MFLVKHSLRGGPTDAEGPGWQCGPGCGGPLARAGREETGLNFVVKKFWMKFLGGDAGRTVRSAIPKGPVSPSSASPFLL